MGSSAGESRDDEHPPHQVALAGYCIDKTEVTVAAYSRCVALGMCKDVQEPVKGGIRADNGMCNGTRADRQNHPVNCVDWNQATAYCASVYKRLPSEAEWEYAARGPDGRTYPWGNEAPSAGRLNACGQECRALGKPLGWGSQVMYEGDDGWGSTAPVGNFPGDVSPFGALDMAGNVSEVMADWGGASDGTTNPAFSYRVERGGAWNSRRATSAGTARRTLVFPKSRDSWRGFRCARGDAEAPQAAEDAKRAADARRVAEAKRAAVDARRASDASPSGMVSVPGGTFLMGSPARRGEPNERPQHVVTLTSYYLDRTEVTVADYARCVASGKCTPASEPAKDGDARLCNGTRADRQDHPVNCVDWNQANAYCASVNKRLPTEAEWEYAASGDDGRRYPWGNEVASAKRLNACRDECRELAKRLGETWSAEYQDRDEWEATAPVGSFPEGASRFGALDMDGNVWEWTADWYAAYGPEASTNPSGPKGGIARVYRGGGWRHDARAITYRAAGSPRQPASDLGFRCVRSVDETRRAAELRAAEAKAAEVKAAEARRAAESARHTGDAGTKVPGTSSGCPGGMVHVPGGTFSMGSSDEVGEDDEHPQHTVTLTGYCIDKTEVTVAAYARCVASGQCIAVSEPAKEGNGKLCNGTRSDRQDHPVNCIDWSQARTYCESVGQRLPSEAEWEYAARGADGRKYPWGNEDPSPKQLNLDFNAWEATAPVGSFPEGTSPFGALDMGGNVWEWTADWDGAYPSGTTTNPRGPKAGFARVYRGGGWDSLDSARTALRNRNAASFRSHLIGFRCARGD